MIFGPNGTEVAKRWGWWLLFGALALYVAARMGAFSPWIDVATPTGTVRLPNTYASVDHPFHVARAETLWRESASGRLLRWVGQHQGGYPVEFYPLGEAWFEVAIRALSLGTFTAQGAHTLAVIALFLLPGLAFAALGKLDGWSPAVGLLALTLHVSLPGGSYHGGYTELVQWGLVTNVAGAVAALLMLPLVIRFLATGDGWAGASAALLAAFAVYSNPRSLFGLAALGIGAWLAVVLGRQETNRRGAACGAPTAVMQASGPGIHGVSIGVPTARIVWVALLTALLAAPELVALVRFGDLYSFVRYSDYDGIVDYATTSVGAVSWPVLALAVVGLGLGFAWRRRLATTSVAVSLLLYILLTAAIAFVPLASRVVPQLEPTRLMPLQRFLSIYLAAVAAWAILDWLLSRVADSRVWVAPVVAVGLAVAVLLVQTRPVDGPPDPASPTIPEVSLYPVAMSAQPEQFEFQLAVRAADEAALPGTALLVLGSALSWHQQLWAPLWTERPLFYNNWLWYWHPDHAGTPGYAFLAGHHYPDPELTLERSYLSRHGIGAVVVTGEARAAAARSPLLALLRSGTYDAYAVVDPVTTVTFGNRNAALLDQSNQELTAVAETPGQPVAVSVNWYPRWDGHIDGRAGQVAHRDDGYMTVASAEPARSAELIYRVQPADWIARLLAATGLIGVGRLVVRSNRRWMERSLVSSLLDARRPNS